MRNALLFGIVWGLAELVVGTVLHLFPFGVFAVCLLYPIGFYCMFRVYLRTGSIAGVLCCGITAAAIKLLALLLTTSISATTAAFAIISTPPEFIIKPAIFILSETAATAFVLYAPDLYSRIIKNRY